METEAAGLIASVTPVILDHEGERLKVYKDSLGIPTVGVGLALMQKTAHGLVPSSYAHGICTSLGLDFDGLLNGTVMLTQEQSRNILSRCIIDVVEWLTQVFPDLSSYTMSRQTALVDMGFNLGENKFRGFKQMISCILAEDWNAAAANALHSRWALELPARSASDVERMRRG